jgi:AbrB family looped-hinge helix DNA binding protein
MGTMATTTLSSKGQVVIPEDVRKALGLEPGAQFVVMGEGDLVILKLIETPARSEYQALASKARGQARRAGLSRSAGVRERAAQMTGTDRLDVHRLHPGKGKARLGIGGAERRQRVEVVDQSADGARRRQRAVDGELGHRALAAASITQPHREKCAQRLDLVSGHRETSRHRVPAAAFEMARFESAAHDGPKVDARNRARRPAAEPNRAKFQKYARSIQYQTPN